MPTIPKYDPPALLDDFDAFPGLRDDWSTWISETFENSIRKIEEALMSGESSQYYNETKTATDADHDPESDDKDIVWDGFPKVLSTQFSRSVALAMADELEPWVLQNVDTGFLGRIQDEYCEWRLERDPSNDNKIVRIVFTCEGPEYWAAMSGDGFHPLYGDFGVTGNKDELLNLYKSVLGPSADVERDDLLFPADFPYPSLRGKYNPHNKWNTTDGIVHLQQGANNLGAEITIGGDATVLRQKGGESVTDATELICCGQFGEINRSSDPTMGDEINKLAQDGYAITLRNPVGIYFHSFNNTGITQPNVDGVHVPADNYWKPLRGKFDSTSADPGNMTGKDTMVVRAVYEVPAGQTGPNGEQLTISDLKIGGERIEKGGQLAEKIQMKFIGRVTRKDSFDNSSVSCKGKCCQAQLPNGRRVLIAASLGNTCNDVFPAAQPLVASGNAIDKLMIGRSRVS